MTNVSSERILVAGGGIGGLAVAIALAKVGIATRVLEGRPEFAIAGAGIQLGPNGIRVLQDLGVCEALAPFAGVPEAIEVHAGASGRRLAQLPLGQWIAQRHGAPYWVAHRADLHAALLQVAQGLPLVEITRGFAVQGVRQADGAVEVWAEDGARAHGSALIGADGLWSAVRAAVSPGVVPVFAGASASRTVIPRLHAGRLAQNTVGLWLHPKVHVVHYPVRAGQEIAVVVVAEETWQSRVWDAQADQDQLAAQVAPFDVSLTSVLGAAKDWRRWSLNRLPELPQWNNGRLVLMGDAAHPMFPYLAQGGVLALEDAEVLARALAETPADPPRAFAKFAAIRKPRARRVQLASERNGRIYHLAGVMARARDVAFAAAPGAVLMAGLDWLYGWKA